MARDLSDVPDGTDVLIDTNIFVYGLTHSSPQCKAFLERCSKEELYGITLFEVVHEATHKFMLAEGRAKDLFASKGVDYLSKNPDDVKRLTDYWINTSRLLALNLVLLPMEEDIVSSAQSVRVASGLLTNDSIIVSAMKEYGIVSIASNDRAFEGVSGVTLYSPTDM